MDASNYTEKPPASASESNFLFYDVESLHNVFTVAVYFKDTGDAAVFYLIDTEPDSDLTPEAVAQEYASTPLRLNQMLEANPSLLARRRELGSADEQVTLFDLDIDANAAYLAQLLGGAVDTRGIHTAQQCVFSGTSIVCDTNPDYHPHNRDHYFVTGYNSNQYDTTILALYLSLRFDKEGRPTPVTARQIREHNDAIFAFAKSPERPPMPRYLSENGLRRAGAIRANWLSSGRHLDVARLNELQQRVALKRLLGMLGYQILESDKLSGPGARVDNLDEFFELVSYNISDSVGTAYLFAHPAYSGSFDLRAGLLRTYPETVFDHTGNYRTPDLDTSKVLAWPRPRLTVDTSSAQFAGRILAPYRDLADIPGHVADLPVVSFRYPDPLCHDHPEPGENVLTATRDFFFQHVPTDTAAGRAAHEAFKPVYDYYRTIEGLSFNSQAADRQGPMATKSAALKLFKGYAEEPDASEQAQDLYNELRGIIDTPPEHLRTVQMTDARGRGYFDNAQRYFSYGRFRSWFIVAYKFISEHASPETLRVQMATLNRLRAYMLALADSAQPYWPEDRPKDLDSTKITMQLDPNDWTNTAHVLAEVAKPPANIPYFTSGGEPTSCFVTFSTGGIHGAEADMSSYREQVHQTEQRWARFRAALETAHAEFTLAQGQVRAGVADDKTTAIITEGLEWVEANHTDMPTIEDQDGHPYSGRVLATASWWLRKRIRIEVTDPVTGQIETVKWDDVLRADRKAGDPRPRTVPKHHRTPHLFAPKDSKYPATVPPEGEHNENRLDPRFRLTSVADVIHEDFTSYYPLMLVNLAAFTNPDLAEAGQAAPDRYSEIFDDKERYGKLMKDPGLSAAERSRYKVLREGTKLILNAASGAADANHQTPILMNNMVITMRIIGQLFSWRIGQAQTFAGGAIVSTNTDGLYSTLDWDTNQRVLDEHAESIGVEIEPEPLTLVSKDSNNRVEFFTAAESLSMLTDNSRGQAQFTPEQIADKPWYRVVASAGGGDLACWAGPNPQKALAHPAMSDRLLVEYFKRIVGGYQPPHPPVPYAPATPLDIRQPMHAGTIHQILDELTEQLSVTEMLRLYQNLIASSPGVNSYLYAAQYRPHPLQEGQHITATDTAMLTYPGDDRNVTQDPALLEAGAVANRHPAASPVTLLDHYTRIFLVDPDKVDTELFGLPLVIASARAAKVSTTTHSSRIARGVRPVNPEGADPVARHLLGAAGEDPAELASTRDILLGRHSGLDPAQPVLAFNNSLTDHPEPRVLQALLESVDRSAYVDLVSRTFDENWRNADGSDQAGQIDDTDPAP